MEIFGFQNLHALSFGDSESLPLLRAPDYLLAGCTGFARLAAAGEPVPDDFRELAAHGLSRMMHAALNRKASARDAGQTGEIMASDAWIHRVAQAFHGADPGKQQSR
ncbi:MAG: hypothetical protein HZC55_23065 [Verrucomicrobia bacterium]|nr:hypothetical protein [Verrucomicrobiota bacterium]